MKLLRKDYLAMLGICFGLCLQTNAQTPSAPSGTKGDSQHKPAIMLKLDDFGNDHPGWRRVIQFLQDRKIKSSIGVICVNLERAPLDGHRFDYVRDMQRSGLFEFWFHGYDHMEWVDDQGFQHNEFDGRPYDELKRRFDLSQDLAIHRFGFGFRVVGPPGGGALPKGMAPGKSAPGRGLVSATAYQVVQDDPRMKIWLYGTPIDAAGKELAAKGKVTILDRDANIENPTFVPNPERFEKEYLRSAATRDYLVLQGHPWAWSDERFANFVKIIDFLVAQGVTFTTPSEYCHLPPLEIHATDGTWTPPASTPAPTAAKP